MLTTDKNEPKLLEVKEGGQNEAYLVLSDEEKAKGFVRPVRQSYIHIGNKVDGIVEVLSEEDILHYEKYGYYAFIKYGEDKSPLAGRYLTKTEYDNIKDGYYGGCGTSTRMALSIAETYARNPKFYGATFCSGCGKHLPVGEFVWDDQTNEVVGS